jgi:hypothetical protein
MLAAELLKDRNLPPGIPKLDVAGSIPVSRSKVFHLAFSSPPILTSNRKLGIVQLSLSRGKAVTIRALRGR